MTCARVSEQWNLELDDLFVNIGHRFSRVELRRRMRDYVRGLLAPVARKNSWQLAEQAGHATPDGLQHLLAGAKWNPDGIRDDLQEYVADKLGESDGVLIIDDTGFIKKGPTSAGVQRQYSGTAGRTENCQIGVFAAYATTLGRALVDRELYLPKSWTEDRERCRAARVLDEREFATKGQLARRVVLRSLASSLPISWVTADAAYGQESRFRRLLEQSGVGYVLAVPKSQFTVGCPRIDGLFAQAPDEAWEKISCGDGAKGPRVYHWAAVRLPAVDEFDYQGEAPHRMRWALARRSIRRPDEIAYFLAYAPLETTVQELVRIAGTRWAIEECFQAAKNECGLDQYEVRRYVGWYRHITLAMLAHAFLAATAQQVQEKGVAPMRRPGHRVHSGGGSATPGSLSSQAPTPSWPPRTTSRVELVEMAPTTPSSRPPLPLLAALSHDRGAARPRPPLTPPQPARFQPPSETRRSDIKILLEY